MQNIVWNDLVFFLFVNTIQFTSLNVWFSNNTILETIKIFCLKNKLGSCYYWGRIIDGLHTNIKWKGSSSHQEGPRVLMSGWEVMMDVNYGSWILTKEALLSIRFSLGEGVMYVRPCDNYLISLYSIGFNKILCKVRFPILDIIVVKGAYNRNT